MERISASARINNMCMPRTLDDSDINKMQIWFSLLYSLEFKDVMMDLS